MLLGLKIENIAIIEESEISFESGLNVLTGETGAGKSIIIDSINAVLGERTSKELIRTGASSAKVTALFSNISSNVQSKLSEFDIEYDDASLVLQRSINADEKNVCRINGVPATASMLKQIGRELINIHGQHDNQALLSPEKHFQFIDSMAGNEELLEKYREQFNTLLALKDELKSISMNEAEKARKIEMLDFQIEELENARLRTGEREELTNQKTLYINSEKVIGNLHAAYAALKGDDEAGGAADAIELAAQRLEFAGEYFGDVSEIAQAVREMSYSISDHAAEIRNLMHSLDYDPSELEEIEERLDLLYRISRKYGSTEEEMLAFLENATAERNSITLSDQRAIELEREITDAEEKTYVFAKKLSESRKKAALEFAGGVKKELAFLDMPNVDFVADIKQIAAGINGIDQIEFLICANAGEVPKPLAKIASGGELSRIMLAIKNVISTKDNIDTLIFDEIDTGVSGRAAQKIAMKLHQVSEGRQVICVTHLAQIAAQAQSHLKISKNVVKGKTYTKVDKLDYEGRQYELARILGGLEITDLQLMNAREMLDIAKNS